MTFLFTVFYNPIQLICCQTTYQSATRFTLTHTTLTLFFTDEAVPVSAGVVVPVGRGRKDGATVLVMSVVVRLAFNK